jgi:hypothetical protein
MFDTQLITEAVMGKHNITDFVAEEISTISKADIQLALDRAKVFLTKTRDNLEQKARVEEIVLLYPMDEACQLIVNALLETIILIKPSIGIRRGKEVTFAGVAPIQAIATQIGLHLHKDQIDAVETGIELLSNFEDLGIYEVRVVAEEDRAQNKGGHIEVHGDSAVIIPTMEVSARLYHKINMTQYLPPMLVKPLQY